MKYAKYAMVLAAVAGIGLSLMAKLYEFGGHGYMVLAGFAVPLLLGGIGAATSKGLTRPTAVLCALGFGLVVLKMRAIREGDGLLILIAGAVGLLLAIALLVVKEHTEPKLASE